MKNILITGAPGIGKTTIIKKLAEKLQGTGDEADGFYTEEIRNKEKRVGFDIVSLNHNRRATLADKRDIPDQRDVKRLGQYTVYVKKFEDLALPIVSNYTKGILIIDEIGKMELFSKKFEQAMSNAFQNKQLTIIATVPLKGPPFVESLKRKFRGNVFYVDETNRVSIPDEILKKISSQIKQT